MLKKIALGMTIIACLSLTSQVFADDLKNLIGKKVDGVSPLYIDGQRVSNDVVIIQQTAYFPVRASSSVFGYDVDYQDGNVLLYKQTKPAQPGPKEPKPNPQPTPEPTSPTAPNPKQEDDHYLPSCLSMITKEMIEQEIKNLQSTSQVYNKIISSLTEAAYNSNVNKQLTEYYEKLTTVQMELQFWNELLKIRSTNSCL